VGARRLRDLDPEAWIKGFERFLHGPHRSLAQIPPDLVQLNDRMVRHTLTAHVLPVVARGEQPLTPTPVVDVNRRRRQIDVPVLAINGALDAADHLRFARELVATVPRGCEVLVPDTAHYPNTEAPAAFNDALRTFLAELDTRPR
jgi:pimeloyl-ACP methyl ester carboxylesterase